MSAQVNGPSSGGGGGKFIDSIDPDDPEYIKSMIRPAEVKEDVQQMEERKRVSAILNTDAFKKHLEDIAIDQIQNGPSPAGLLALQQIQQLLVPKGGAPFSATAGTQEKPTPNIIPIADIRGQDTLNYSKGEKLLRCKFASLHRLMDVFGWSAGIHAYCTVRLTQDFEHFLILPHGMLYQEVSAASLVKVDMAGEVLDPGTTGLGVNQPAFSLHAAIHAARPDIKCIIHLRNPACISVSSMECGLLPLCTEAVAVGEQSKVEDFIGSLPDQESKDRLTRALGPRNKVLMLANHGIVVGGESIDEAFFLANNIMTGVESQLQALPIGIDRLVLPSEEAQKKSYELANQTSGGDEQGRRKWRKGELEFEGYMRHLDNAGYRTGHMYHEPVTRNNQKKERINSDLEYPPVATSFGAMYEGDGDKLRRMAEIDLAALPDSSPLKQHFDKQKRLYKTDWLNTPNAYRKEQFDETGTPTPKTITKWVADASPNKSVPSPVKVENPNQFAPQGENPKEYKQKFQAIKKEYYTDKIDAGPQSRILEGVTWEEAQKIKDGHVSGTSDSVIVVGAASKGIIQRDHQHNAVVYKTYYAPNPFDNMTEEEIEQYKQQVGQERKEGEESGVDQGGAGEPAAEEALEPGPDGKLISTEERLEQVRQREQAAPPQSIDVTQQQVLPKRQYVETSLDDLTETTTTQDRGEPARITYKETSIDDVVDSGVVVAAAAQQQPASPVKDQPAPQLQRSNSAGKADKRPQLVQELQDFDRTKSRTMPRPKKNKGTVNGDQLASPTKSTTSSGDGTLDERSSREGSPSKESAPDGSPTKEKKKKKFRMPSFSKKKDKKEKEKK